jgi:hypothetical protein
MDRDTRQTDTKTVPKTCEVNEKISKRRTETHTHTPCCNYIIDIVITLRHFHRS